MPPLHLPLGSDTLDQTRQKLADLRRDFDARQKRTRSTDFVERLRA